MDRATVEAGGTVDFGGSICGSVAGITADRWFWNESALVLPSEPDAGNPSSSDAMAVPVVSDERWLDVAIQSEFGCAVERKVIQADVI